jgi:hypothetical protein
MLDEDLKTKVENIVDWFLDRTLHKLAEKYGIRPKEREAINIGGHKVYSSDTVFEWLKEAETLKNNARKNMPVKYFLLYKLPRIIRAVALSPWTIYESVYYFFHWRFVGKYHIIKIGKPGYYDPNYVMELAIEQCFIRFLEEGALYVSNNQSRSVEDGLKYMTGQINAFESENHTGDFDENIRGWKELIKAHIWFFTERPELEAQLKMIAITDNYDEYSRIADLITEKNTKFYQKLIKYRGKLYT